MLSLDQNHVHRQPQRVGKSISASSANSINCHHSTHTEEVVRSVASDQHPMIDSPFGLNIQGDKLTRRNATDRYHFPRLAICPPQSRAIHRADFPIALHHHHRHRHTNGIPMSEPCSTTEWPSRASKFGVQGPWKGRGPKVLKWLRHEPPVGVASLGSRE